MPACHLYFILGIILFLVGLVAMLLRFGENKTEAGQGKASFLSILFVLILLGGATMATLNLQAYVNCKAKAGTCPARFPAGSTGYYCTNEGAQCGYAQNCVTVDGFWPWESDCECVCKNTALLNKTVD